ncbi:MAG: hypothetical protein ABSE95_19145 [Thermodesulfobacteriota bacterium]
MEAGKNIKNAVVNKVVEFVKSQNIDGVGCCGQILQKPIEGNCRTSGFPLDYYESNHKTGGAGMNRKSLLEKNMISFKWAY